MHPDDERAEELREKLSDYYGTAMASGMPMAVIDLSRIDRMTDEEIEKEAEKIISDKEAVKIAVIQDALLSVKK